MRTRTFYGGDPHGPSFSTDRRPRGPRGGGDRFCFSAAHFTATKAHLGDSGGHNFYHLVSFMNTKLYSFRFTLLLPILVFHLSANKISQLQTKHTHNPVKPRSSVDCCDTFIINRCILFNLTVAVRWRSS